MWKAGGWWVTRKSFCTVCCRFGTQTGLRKKNSSQNSYYYHWNMLILSRAKKQRCMQAPTFNRPERFNEVYTWWPLWIELMACYSFDMASRCGWCLDDSTMQFWLCVRCDHFGWRSCPKDYNTWERSKLVFCCKVFFLLTFMIHCEPVVWQHPNILRLLDVCNQDIPKSVSQKY